MANYDASNVEATTGPGTVENPDTRVGIQIISLRLIPGRRIMVKESITGHRTEIQRRIIEGPNQNMDYERIRDLRLALLNHVGMEPQHG